jgi:LysR family glycine cleavage system transcriptional activator
MRGQGRTVDISAARGDDPAAANIMSASSGPPSSKPPIRKALPPFESLRAFDAVARLGGVRRAAQVLCRDHAAVSRHLRTLEAWTGATLIERTSLGVVLTEDGVRYHKQIAQSMDGIAQATLELMRRGKSSRLHIRCRAAFALHWLSGNLVEFEKNNPGTDIELRPAGRALDFSSYEVDVDVRFVTGFGAPVELPDGFRSMDIASVPLFGVASHEYLAGAPPVTQPHDLLKHQLLHEDSFNGWVGWLATHGVHEDVYLTGPRLWQGHMTLDAARHGRGIALSNLLVLADDLAAGRLVEVGRGLESFQPYATGIYQFVAREDRWDAPLIRRFRDWLCGAVAESAERAALR